MKLKENNLTCGLFVKRKVCIIIATLLLKIFGLQGVTFQQYAVCSSRYANNLSFRCKIWFPTNYTWVQHSRGPNNFIRNSFESFLTLQRNLHDRSWRSFWRMKNWGTWRNHRDSWMQDWSSLIWKRTRGKRSLESFKEVIQANIVWKFALRTKEIKKL